METIKNFIMNYPEISSKVFREAERCGEANDNDRVAHKIIRRLDKQFSKGHRINGRHLNTIIKREIGQARKEYEKRKYNFTIFTFGNLSILDGDGTLIEFEPNDVLADVEEIASFQESERTINRKIARLATGDYEMVILKAWSEGYYKTNEVARILANTFNGKIDTHVRNINRFKNKCEKSISTIKRVLAS